MFGGSAVGTESKQSITLSSNYQQSFLLLFNFHALEFIKLQILYKKLRIEQGTKNVTIWDLKTVASLKHDCYT